MKVWLDDERPEPVGWVRATTVKETIRLIQSGATLVSLDNDLGQHTLDSGEEGWQVLAWLEEQIFTNPDFAMPVVYVHTANPVARKKMLATLASIQRFQKHCASERKKDYGRR